MDTLKSVNNRVLTLDSLRVRHVNALHTDLETTKEEKIRLEQDKTKLEESLRKSNADLNSALLQIKEAEESLANLIALPQPEKCKESMPLDTFTLAAIDLGAAALSYLWSLVMAVFAHYAARVVLRKLSITSKLKMIKLLPILTKRSIGTIIVENRNL